MASNYTTNYQLNQWEAGDQVLRTEFNQDNQKIDTALAGLAAALILAFRGKGLLPVALTACGTVFLCERLLALIG